MFRSKTNIAIKKNDYNLLVLSMIQNHALIQQTSKPNLSLFITLLDTPNVVTVKLLSYLISLKISEASLFINIMYIHDNISLFICQENHI